MPLAQQAVTDARANRRLDDGTRHAIARADTVLVSAAARRFRRRRRHHLHPENREDIQIECSIKISRRGPLESISLKLPEGMLKASRRNAQAFRLSRAEYLRRAIEKMNTEAEAQLLAERMTRASLKVRRQSLEVNAEFSRIERDPHARSR